MTFPRPQHDNKGFTLIELLVSLSLFIIVVLALVSALYNINNASRKVQAMRSVIDNLNFALESMSRTVRTGSHIVCDGGPSTSGGRKPCWVNKALDQGTTHISVDSTVGAPRTVEYKLGDKNIERCIRAKDGVCGDWVPITAPEIEIERLQFFIDGAATDDGRQPGVMMMVQGVAHAGQGSDLPFSVQTYLSQRVVE